MARLRSEKYLIQQSGGIAELFEAFTCRRIVRFVPALRESVADALEIIRDDPDMSSEDKAFAFFWAGYFHAHSDPDPEMARETFITCAEDGIVTVAAGALVIQFAAADANSAARAQVRIFNCASLSKNEKVRAHFWSGFFYGQATFVPRAEGDYSARALHDSLLKNGPQA